MSFLRSVWADLVEKRLWPIGVALLVALAAVPVAVSKLGGDAPAPAPSPAPLVAPAPAPTDPVKLTTTQPWQQHPRGHYHDPFHGSGAPSGPGAAAAASASASKPAASAPKPAPKPSTPAPAPAPTHAVSAPAPAHSATTTARRAPAPAPIGVPAGYTVDVAFGPEGHAKTRRSLLRLSGLRVAYHNVAGFLGVRRGGRSAAFVLAPGIPVVGEGTCRPSPRRCESVELKPHQVEFLIVNGRYYELKTLAISEHRSATVALSRRFRHRHQRAATQMVAQVVKTGDTFLTRYGYDVVSGALDLHSKPAISTPAVP